MATRNHSRNELIVHATRTKALRSSWRLARLSPVSIRAVALLGPVHPDPVNPGPVAAPPFAASKRRAVGDPDEVEMPENPANPSNLKDSL